MNKIASVAGNLYQVHFATVMALRMEHRGMYLEALHVAGDGGVVMVFDPTKREYVCWVIHWTVCSRR